MRRGRNYISGVLLAAGKSERLTGYPAKQLLDFKGESLVRHSARQALASRLSEVVVVIGWKGPEVRSELAGLDLQIVDNPDYAAGQSTSVKAGLASVDLRAGAAVFISVDQPFLDHNLIDRLIEAYEKTGRPIVLPAYEGRRGSPVLFDRSLFTELSNIAGDEGGRQILGRYDSKIKTVALKSDLPLLDIDTAEDYERLLKKV